MFMGDTLIPSLYILYITNTQFVYSVYHVADENNEGGLDASNMFMGDTLMPSTNDHSGSALAARRKTAAGQKTATI